MTEPLTHSAAWWTKRKAEFHAAMVRDRKLSGLTLAVAAILLDKINTDRSNPRYGQAWPSVEPLVRETGGSRRGVFDAIERLRNRGWFGIKSGKGRRHSNAYVPVWTRQKERMVQSPAPLSDNDAEKVQSPAGNGAVPRTEMVQSPAHDPFYKSPLRNSLGGAHVATPLEGGSARADQRTGQDPEAETPLARQGEPVAADIAKMLAELTAGKRREAYPGQARNWQTIAAGKEAARIQAAELERERLRELEGQYDKRNSRPPGARREIEREHRFTQRTVAQRIAIYESALAGPST